jgi:hypothetical protein
MEVGEIVSYFVNTDTNMIEVSFKFEDDEDDVVRNDSIEFSVAEFYGLDLSETDLDYYPEDFEDDYGDDDTDDEIKIKESELISFLNEYYEVNPDKLPDTELY